MEERIALFLRGWLDFLEKEICVEVDVVELYFTDFHANFYLLFVNQFLFNLLVGDMEVIPHPRFYKVVSLAFK